MQQGSGPAGCAPPPPEPRGCHHPEPPATHLTHLLASAWDCAAEHTSRYFPAAVAGQATQGFGHTTCCGGRLWMPIGPSSMRMAVLLVLRSSRFARHHSGTGQDPLKRVQAKPECRPGTQIQIERCLYLVGRNFVALGRRLSKLLRHVYQLPLHDPRLQAAAGSPCKPYSMTTCSSARTAPLPNTHAVRGHIPGGAAEPILCATPTIHTVRCNLLIRMNTSP